MERTLDEAASAELHIWMSFVRLLLQIHPRVGADEYARLVGQPQDFDSIPGWNCIHRDAGAAAPLAYIWIGTEAKEGRYTATRPDVPEDQIHHVYENRIPEFTDTLACRTLTQLGEILARQPELAMMTEKHWTVLHAAAQAPLRGGDPSVDTRISTALSAIRQGAGASGATLATFEAPLRQVVDDYLGLRLTRRHASNIAAVLLAHLALAIPSPLPAVREAALMGQIDHLIDLTTRIRDERNQYDLASFYTLTCLGLFWAETAQLMATQIAPHMDAKKAKLLQARARYVEECAVHELHPSLHHPFLLVPFGPVAFLASTTRGLITPAGLYAGAGVTDPHALKPEQIWPNLKRYSAAAKPVTVPWDNYLNVLSKELAEHLQMFLLAMTLGRGAPR